MCKRGMIHTGRIEPHIDAREVLLWHHKNCTKIVLQKVRFSKVLYLAFLTKKCVTLEISYVQPGNLNIGIAHVCSNAVVKVI